MQPLSTYSSLLTQNNSMIRTSLLTAKLSNELSTGKRAVDLADNPDRQSILDLTQTKNDKDAYVKSCNIGQITTAQYDVSLQHIEKLATTALKSIQDLMSSSQGRPSPNGSTIPSEQDMLKQFSSLSQTITQALNDATISLNEQSSSGNGYLYSGLRNPSGIPTYTLPPVRDLNTLPYFDSPSGAALDPAHPNPTTSYPAPPGTPGIVDPTVTSPTGLNPGLPVYDADYGAAAPAAPLPSQQTMAWGVQKLTIDTNETVNLNITSNSPAFQNLINGLRAAKTAADQAGAYPTAERDKYMSLAFSNLTRAINGGLDTTTNTWDPGIRDLEQQNSITQLAMQTKVNTHNADLNIINTRLDSLVGVDTTTVTVELATADNQLQATYKATASLLSMSLTNYLK